MDDLTGTYCRMVDCYKAFEPQLKARLLTDGKRHRSRRKQPVRGGVDDPGSAVPSDTLPTVNKSSSTN
ncbi:MAG: hypothetical protein J5X22_01000 [Candidatus Accumulibacter sp.]|uniref:Uncharacterized protein n=1 Tax=Candidatus Accumulibacter cognatus TaxID=2954383 RepID=A0A7D5NGN1_9PROT|nr:MULTISPECIES: hypothetical protein [Candidatus Accumulibacter]QLH51749.1 MAG: hypothetical protein HWD57_19575 [Candidatus Accumulibacter cognatus]MBL8402368.1 hypothetical protein [Accumulibacter sp.]MBN8520255.1 hypothetical protein [Accumulibacter sp.]MBO3709132.1 hypothetical protein [Accumulibacter sp.]MCM8622418.1 hypothetical protein [Accumulibacter sp.]